MTPHQLAAYLGVPVNTVYRWRTLGIGPRGFRVGRHTRFRRADVDAWLEQGATPQ
jgi:excisionase family DNA binding protein